MNCWQELKGNYCTTRDPLWVCPICGNGRHLYGVENWDGIYLNCPDCGVPLKYPFQHDNKEN